MSSRGAAHLLLGQPGAGKTFALLTLMQELIDRARAHGVGVDSRLF